MKRWRVGHVRQNYRQLYDYCSPFLSLAAFARLAPEAERCGLTVWRFDKFTEDYRPYKVMNLLMLTTTKTGSRHVGIWYGT